MATKQPRDPKGRFIKRPKAKPWPDWWHAAEELWLTVQTRPEHVLEVPKIVRRVDALHAD